jgi:hypothetical protein
MTSLTVNTNFNIIIIDKYGKCTQKKVKNLDISKLYKHANFKGNKDWNNRHTWYINEMYISIYSKDSGRSGSENKYELPPPIDEKLYFGKMVIVAHSEDEITNETCIDLSVKDWEKVYESLMGGFESLGEEEEEEEEEIPDELKTNGGYMKDGFVVSDDEEIEYENSSKEDSLEEKSVDYGDEEEEEEEEYSDVGEEESEEESEEEESDEDYLTSEGSELETEESSSDEKEEEEEEDEEEEEEEEDGGD